MVGVVLGSAFGVDGGGWEEFGVSVGGESGLPAAVVVEQPVVEAADQAGVREVGGAAVGPGPQVMGLAPACRPIVTSTSAAVSGT